jgi:predicted nucleotidyltransferase
MQNPFLRSASRKFASRSQLLNLARRTAQRIAANHPEVSRVILFGSFARGDFGARSDLDLLIVLKSSQLPIRERIGEFIAECGAYPTDVFPLTEAELESRLQNGDPFWMQAMREGIECFRR